MRGPEKGFTLIETLVALGLLTLSLVALTRLPIGTVQASSQARYITAATNLARAKLEEIRAADFASVSSGSDSLPLAADGETDGAGAIYTRSWVVDAGPTAKTKEVRVTVRWTDVGPRRVILATVIHG